MNDILKRERPADALPAFVDGREAHYAISVQDRVDPTWHASSRDLSFGPTFIKDKPKQQIPTRRIGAGIECTMTYAAIPCRTCKVLLNASHYDSGVALTHSTTDTSQHHKMNAPIIIDGTAAVYLSPSSDRSNTKLAVHIPEQLEREIRYISAVHHDNTRTMKLDKAVAPDRQARLLLIDGGAVIEQQKAPFKDLVSTLGARAIIINDGMHSYTISPLALQTGSLTLPERGNGWSPYIPTEGISITSLTCSMFSIPADMWLRNDAKGRLVLDGSRRSEAEVGDTIFNWLRKTNTIVFGEPLLLTIGKSDDKVSVHYPSDCAKFAVPDKLFISQGQRQPVRDSGIKAGHLFPAGTVLKKIALDPAAPPSFQQLVDQNPDSVVLMDSRGGKIAFALKIPMDRDPVLIPKV